MNRFVGIVAILTLFGCTKEAEKEAESASASASRAIAEARSILPESPRNQEGEIDEAEIRLEKEREWAVALEKTNNERMAKKLGLTAEAFSNLTIEEQKELIRKHRGRK